jgi:hypothetical protein
MAQLVFRPFRATLPQQQTARQVMADLNTALGQDMFALARRGRHRLTFADAAMSKDPPEVLGWAEEDVRCVWTVAIRPHLQGAALYQILCHELGHVLGLDHVRGRDGFRHIMSASLDPLQNTYPIGQRVRLRFAVQIATLLAKIRLTCVLR